ncbi:PNPOx family protein [Streptomyces sparsus]
MATPTTGLANFASQKRVRLTTYGRDGTPQGYTANLAVEGDRGYFRTYSRADKNEHLRRYPEVEIVPATMDGTPAGAPLKARVRRLEGQEARHAARRLARKHPLMHGVLVPIGYALKLDRPVHYELRLIGE